MSILRSSKFWIFSSLYLGSLACGFLLSSNWDLADRITLIQTIAVILTGFILIWYTWETAQLGKETRDQTETQLRPFVVLKPTQDGFEISNIGNGPAINVHVCDVQIDQVEDIIIRFPQHVLTLPPGVSVPIPAESFHGGESTGDFFFAHLDNNYANRRLLIKMEFQNINLRSYSIEQVIVPRDWEILDVRIAGVE